MPLMDSQQNLELLEGKETSQFTMLKFSRKLKTCDLNDRAIEVIREGRWILEFIYSQSSLLQTLVTSYPSTSQTAALTTNSMFSFKIDLTSGRQATFEVASAEVF